MKKLLILSATIVMTLVTFSAVERIFFFKGEMIIKANEAKDIDVLAAQCKMERGSSAVLEVLKDGDTSYARCGMWWPSTDTYVIRSNK